MTETGFFIFALQEDRIQAKVGDEVKEAHESSDLGKITIAFGSEIPRDQDRDDEAARGGKNFGKDLIEGVGRNFFV